MIACLRPLSALFLAGLLTACASSPSSRLGELPSPSQASVEQLLQQADKSKPEKAALLRLTAADQAYRQKDLAQAMRILEQIPLDSLKPAQQIFASTLGAEIALARNNPKVALKTLDHPSMQHLGELPIQQQIRTQLTRARALEADGQHLSAARERIFIAPLLSESNASENHERIWRLIQGLPLDALNAPGEENSELGGWLALARGIKSAGTLELQQAAIDQWRAANPQHPAALQLPVPLIKLRELASQPLNKIALLLPEEGQLASVSRALRNGFMAAYYQAQQLGQQPPSIELYDSSRLTSIDDFYRQAQAAGVQLVVGPLEKTLVKQLGDREQLPITTLALNYGNAGQEGPPQLFQFGLAAEDEARGAARRAWADGMRRGVAMVPSGEWGDRVLQAFQQSWQAAGGNLVAVVRIDQPAHLAQQIAELFQLRQSEARGKRLQAVLGSEVVAQPSRRRDIDFIFLAATPQQAQQIKPTLAFQYAGDVPIYATSHLYSPKEERNYYLDLEGIQFCETPWLLDANPNDNLPQLVGNQWPQAKGSLGRLYAMGVDAYRVAPRLAQLKALPETRIDGLSGNLSLSPDQRIQRQLPWAAFRDGQIQRLPASGF
ncbi:penicillin-binding protein activator [Azotobacter vinelandii]|uniref:penicillin-binding protein activator n=1 Tax=Azotobacter vinelandii TaxID=354 RepID=UPI0026653E9A|nr:penicillin-binding protein activator [Azotobacter vinelandii]WKN23323.1 penicillin-binding protein activator [Azotobacter vinelandii]